jgi:photosystem II stability/assembly factor-like uncharacterized protein
MGCLLAPQSVQPAFAEATGQIVGYVTDGPTGVPIGHSQMVYRLDPVTQQWAVYNAPTSGGPGGYYIVSSLPAGTYRVQVSESGYRTGFSPDATTLAGAQDIQVVAGQDTRADVVLYPMECIDATVVSAIPQRLLDPLSMFLWRQNLAGDWSVVASQTAPSWGSSTEAFRFYGVDSGTYRITVKDWFGEYTDLASATGQPVADASDIVVGRGQRVAPTVTMLPAHLWTPQNSATTDTLYGVDFPDASHGWAVGDNGTIVRTADAGRTWTKQVSGVTTTLHALDFLSDQEGWAVGDGGVVLHTQDGGTKWSPLSVGATNSWLGVSFADAQHGWITGGNEIWATTDGGATWVNQASSVITRSITCSDADHAWASGYWGSVFSTKDGGATWTTQQMSGPPFLYSIAHAGGSKLWAVGGLDNVMESHDGGATWNSMAVPENGMYPAAVSCPDSQTAFVVGYPQGNNLDTESVYVTSDGGASWYEDTSPTSGHLNAVSAPDATHAWAVGGGGTIVAWTSQDIVAPTTTATTDPLPNALGWEHAETTVSFSAVDNYRGSGVAKTEHSLDGAPGVTSSKVTVSTDGVHEVRYWSTDASGNVEPTQTLTVRVDTAPPTTSDDHATSYVSSAVIHLSAVDGGSGVARTDYRLDGAPATGKTITVAAVGAHALTYWSTDAAGNGESPHTVAFLVRRSAATSTKVAGAGSVRLRHRYAVAGTVSPGISRGVVTVVVERLSGHSWKRATSTTARVSGGKFGLTYTPKSRGTWRVRVTFAGQIQGNLAYRASSATRGFRVR